jgi:hypothetical protein
MVVGSLVTTPAPHHLIVTIPGVKRMRGLSDATPQAADVGEMFLAVH